MIKQSIGIGGTRGSSRHGTLLKRLGLLTVTATLAACSSGPSAPGTSKGTGAGGPAAGQTGSATIVVPTVNAGGGPAAGGPTARIRVVNVYAVPGSSAAILMFAGSKAGAESEAILTVPYGVISDYLSVPVETGLTIIAQNQLGKADARPMYSYPTAGEQETIAISGPLDATSPGFDAHTVTETIGGHDGRPFPTASPGQAVIDIWPAALLPFESHQGDSSFYYGSGKDCLTRVNGAPGMGFGGNVDNAFVAPASSFQLVAWSGGCGSTVRIGPSPVDASSGRLFVIPYGPSFDRLSFFVVPIPAVAPGG